MDQELATTTTEELNSQVNTATDEIIRLAQGVEGPISQEQRDSLTKVVDMLTEDKSDPNSESFRMPTLFALSANEQALKDLTGATSAAMATESFKKTGSSLGTVAAKIDSLITLREQLPR